MLNVSFRIGDILSEYIQHDIITEQPHFQIFFLDITNHFDYYVDGFFSV